MLKIVLNHNNCDAKFLINSLHNIKKSYRCKRVKIGCRFVKKQYSRLHNHN